jgi:hypothetical protein
MRILRYAQDDDVKQATATATAGPCGMTNKRTNNGKSNDEIQGSFAMLRMTT